MVCAAEKMMGTGFPLIRLVIVGDTKERRGFMKNEVSRRVLSQQPQHQGIVMGSKIALAPRAFARLILTCVLALSGSGCIAALAIPFAPIVGGVLPSDNKVIVDETTVTPELKIALSEARKLTFFSSDQSDTFTAEYLEQHGGYEVTLEDPPKAASPSQKKKLMGAVCKQANRPDLVFSFSSTESDAGGGTVLRGVVTGRAKFNLTVLSDVVRCRDKWTSQFSVRAEMSQGIYNADSTKMSQVIGVEFAKALMQLAGKLPPAVAEAK